MTEKALRPDGYARSCKAKAVEINDPDGIGLDHTVFHPDRDTQVAFP